ncbi:MAG: type II toxin-antitoxin system VapC family toxin [Candidatus Methanoplasma sp.]|jgi:predicted nucleic acid-binding protein|nr:type II toxin-antitoxin system VapC family toxin [Candidatus Methanoplasma sp.]
MTLHQPPLFIDTCALSDKEFMKWLRNYSGTKKISSIVYMEFCLYFQKKYSFDAIDKLLLSMKVEIEPFEKKHAKNAVSIMDEQLDSKRCPACNKLNWNDSMITAHVPCAPAILVTKNIKDFPDLDGRVKTPREIMGNTN